MSSTKIFEGPQQYTIPFNCAEYGVLYVHTDNCGEEIPVMRTYSQDTHAVRIVSLDDPKDTWSGLYDTNLRVLPMGSSVTITQE